MNIQRTPIARILSQYINKGYSTAEEIASLLDCSTRRVYKIINESEGHFQDWEIQTLCQHFSTQGHNELSRLFVSGKYSFMPHGELRIDGSVLDENGEVTKVMGKLIEHFNRGEKEQGLALTEELLKQVKQLQTEFKNLD